MPAHPTSVSASVTQRPISGGAAEDQAFLAETDRLDRILSFCRAHMVELYLAYAALFLFVSAIVPALNDYKAYLVQWQIVVDGHDPWRSYVALGANAYGPLHNLYGLLFLLQWKLPRLLGSVLWLVAVWPIVCRILTSSFSSRHQMWLLLAVTLNPFLWGWVAVFGSNDALVAVFLVGAVLCLERGRSGLAGGLVALAGLLKFYPLLVVPFVAFHRGRFDLRFAIAAVGLFAIGMAGAAALWGSAVFVPLGFAAGREPSQLSIYAFLATSALSPLKGIGVPKVIAQAIFALVGLSVFASHVLRRGSNIDGMALGLLTILSAYQLGHFQFYLPLMLLIPLMLVLTRPTPFVARRLLYVVAVVSFFATCYLMFGGLVDPPWLYIRQNCGLPTVIIEAIAIIAMLRRPAPDDGVAAGTGYQRL